MKTLLISTAMLTVLLACSQKSLEHSQVSEVPDPSRFQFTVLAKNLNEPLEFVVMNDKRILFVERRGRIRLFDPASQEVKTIHELEVNTTLTNGNGSEDGLLGLALDPDFENNKWIYLYYSQAGVRPVNVLTRWQFSDDQLLEASKKVVLEVPVQREQCCHTGGSIEFDREGNLFLSTGDNTNPHASHYAPIDERAGRAPWDAQKSAANTNDLRGKILRIKPLENGTYAIPEGNLFPPGTPDTRPEIYAMGVRNPYRISIDPATSFIYWGDVGPDASRYIDGKGPVGYDEINQARAPGFFGWPYFIADNQAYFEFDFETEEASGTYDPLKPINNSPNNTGLQKLPQAQGAFIWYPYAQSDLFPEVGGGGRTAMAGPVYRYALFADAASPFPQWFDNKLFIYEWMRGWINTVTLSAQGDYVSMERFMPELSLSAPVDMAFGPEGSLYVLEYGRAWFQPNADARLIRIDYIKGNRAPITKAVANTLAGSLPFNVSFSALDSFDPDGDALTYRWQIKNQKGELVTQNEHAQFTYQFDDAGQYEALLTVTDTSGAQSSQSLELIAGNSPPDIQLDILDGNSMFFFPNTAIRYKVAVTDAEDGVIQAETVAVTLDFLPVGYDKVEVQQGHVQADKTVGLSAGEMIIADSDCAACHQKNGESIGPSFVDIARFYKGKNKAQASLVKKIIEGGSGVWGETAMPPHADMSIVEARTAVKYILAVAEEKLKVPLPLQGEFSIKQEEIVARDGTVILRAAYEDRGVNDLPSIKAEKTLTLDNPYIDASEVIEEQDINFLTVSNPPVSLKVGLKDGAYLKFAEMDLRGVKAIDIFGAADPEFAVGGYIEVRLGSETGELLGKSESFVAQEMDDASFTQRINLAPREGRHSLTFVYKNNDKRVDKALFIIKGFSLLSGNEK